MRRDYVDFQERSVPLAFLITIRCYGTWLHGDERGSVDRVEYNKYGLPRISQNAKFVEYNQVLMAAPPIHFDSKARVIVEAAVKEYCEYHKLTLHAINVRTNHAHVVIAAGDSADKMMGSIKAYATRRLRADGYVSPSARVWSRHGSTKYLWSEKHIFSACDYVNNGQGGELPAFD